MTKFKLTTDVSSNIGAINTDSPFVLENGTNLWYDNRWKASIEIESESGNQAMQLGEEIIDKGLLIFQLFVPINSPSKLFMYRTNNGSQIENLDTHKVGAASGTYNSYTYDALELKEEMQVYLKREIENFQKSPILSKIRSEDGVKVPLYYYQRAMEEQDPVYVFLNLMFCLESMISDNFELAEKISRRIAILISSDYDDKQNTYKKIKKYYNTRSAISHGNKVPDISGETIGLLSSYVRVALRNYLILMNEYGSQQNIKETLDQFFDAEKLKEIGETINTYLGR